MDKIKNWNSKISGKYIAEMLLQRLKEKIFKNFFLTCYNPLKIGVLIFEFLTHLSRHFVNSKNSIMWVRNEYYRFICDYCGIMTD
jgi:hypothetical protein